MSIPAAVATPETSPLRPLRGDLEIVEHDDRSSYFVVQEPASGKIYGFNARTIELLKLFDGKRTAAELAADVATSRSAAEVQRLTQQIDALALRAQSANLLADAAGAAPVAAPATAASRARAERGRNIFFLRLVAFDPQPVLRFVQPILGPFFSPLGWVCTSILALLALGLLVSHRDRLFVSFEVFRYFAYWVWVYVLMFAASAVHELGHLVAYQRCGGRAKEVGLALYMLQPAAYADVSEAWLFPQRGQRIMVALGGLYLEAVIAGGAVLVWWWSAPFTVTNQVAFVFTLVLLTRVVLNLLPLLRLDGYWVLVDLLRVRNLRYKALALLLSFLPGIGRQYAGVRRQLDARRQAVLSLYAVFSLTLAASAILSALTAAHTYLSGFALWRPAYSLVALSILLPLFVLSLRRHLEQTRSAVATLGPAGSSAESAAEDVTASECLEIDDLRVELGSFRLDGVSLTLRQGEVVAFVGENGAGKTTTLRAIVGLVRKSSGRVRIGPVDHAKAEKRFKRLLSLVPEESHFYGSMTVEWLLRFTASLYPDWDRELENRLIEDLRLDRGKRSRELSKGMRTKLRLVLALASGARYVMLDEPLSGLDPRSRREVRRVLRAAASEEGRGMLFSSHDLGDVEKVADRLVLIEEGRIVMNEPVAELLARLEKSGQSLEDLVVERAR